VAGAVCAVVGVAAWAAAGPAAKVRPVTTAPRAPMTVLLLVNVFRSLGVMSFSSSSTALVECSTL
jgi:hypothetical protein